METIGIGVIGCGGMGRSLATSAHAVEGIEIICVSDLQEALAEKLATDLDASYTLDYHELLADGPDSSGADRVATLYARTDGSRCSERWQTRLL